MSDPIRILSLGAGVQSSTLLLVSCKGVLPKLNAAVFADTQWEPPAVYAHLEWLIAEAARAGIPVHIVSKGNIRADALRSKVRGTHGAGSRAASMPLFVDTKRVLVKDKDGAMVDYTSLRGGGMIRRQCTNEYKIEPIERFLRREVLGLQPRQRAPREVVIDQWMGISSNELRRVRQSPEPWKRHVFPLCNLPDAYLPTPMTRSHCIAWLEKEFPERTVPRSACIGCPYHSNDEWRAIKSDPEMWADVTEFDRAIRHNGGVRGHVYLHRSCKPLDEVDLSTEEERGQINMWGNECSGMCGV